MFAKPDWTVQVTKANGRDVFIKSRVGWSARVIELDTNDFM